MQIHDKTKITLVGADPRDPNLLTIKGAKALAGANVVLYDALANTELLAYAPTKALKIFVGQDKGSVPVAIIQNGKTTTEKIGIGTVDAIEDVVVQKQLQPPTVIVIGEVVRSSHQLKSFYKKVKEDNLEATGAYE